MTSSIETLHNDLVHIQGGIFYMGGDGNESLEREKPIHQRRVSDFYLSRFLITQELWVVVMGENPSFFQGRKNPVESVSWNETQIFISQLNMLTGSNYRLPSEAEWEYAARGGIYSRGFLFAGSNKVNEVCWFRGNSNAQTHPVGEKAPNELGIFDLSGNVEEWCQDHWHENYVGAPNDNSSWEDKAKSDSRVVRAGGWISPANECRLTDRYFNPPDFKMYNIGFRLARSL